MAAEPVDEEVTPVAAPEGADREGSRGVPGAGEREFRPVKSAYRALDVLEAIAGGPSTLAELSRLLDIPKSSLHGLMRTLTDRGWVTPVDGGTRFRLGLRALQVGTRFVADDDLVGLVAPSLDRLAAATGETVQQARLDGNRIVYLAKRDTAHQVRIISSIGSRLPAHATALGKALLASREDDEVTALLDPPLPALTSRTLTDVDALLDELARTRDRGYSVDDGEAAEGLRCFAVAVPSGRGVLPTDAVSVSVPAFRIHPDGESRVVEALLGEQQRLRGLLGA
jgi:DNA-binding IclR family transcriptional regulator